MPIIKEDEHGLYVSAGGWKSRTVRPTQFKVGDEVQTHHFGGSPRCGVGKDDTCKKGQYMEYWITSGTRYGDATDPETLAWYREEYDYLF